MTSVDPSSQLSRFPQFNHLPTEIRLKIWRLALPSRIVEVKLRGHGANPRILKYGATGSRLGSISPTPTILEVCREARHEALTIYKSCDRSTFCPAPHWNPEDDNMLFNPSVDILYFRPYWARMDDDSVTRGEALYRDPWMFEHLSSSPSDVQDIRKIALACNYTQWDVPILTGDLVAESTFFASLAETMRCFKRLEEIILVITRRRRAEMVYIRPDKVIPRARNSEAVAIYELVDPMEESLKKLKVYQDEVNCGPNCQDEDRRDVLNWYEGEAQKIRDAFAMAEKVSIEGWKAPKVNLQMLSGTLHCNDLRNR